MRVCDVHRAAPLWRQQLFLTAGVQSAEATCIPAGSAPSSTPVLALSAASRLRRALLINKRETIASCSRLEQLSPARHRHPVRLTPARHSRISSRSESLIRSHHAYRVDFD